MPSQLEFDDKERETMMLVVVHTCWLVQVGEIRQVIAGLEHGWIHQRGKSRVDTRGQGLD